MVTKLDELYEQRRELQRQIHALDSKIDEETKAKDCGGAQTFNIQSQKAFVCKTKGIITEPMTARCKRGKPFRC